MGLCESRLDPLFCGWKKAVLHGGSKEPLSLALLVVVGSVFPEVEGLVALFNRNRGSLSWKLSCMPISRFQRRKNSVPKSTELQCMNSPAELNKSVCCVVYCKARCILETKQDTRRFFLFLSFSLRNLLSSYELFISSWVLK